MQRFNFISSLEVGYIIRLHLISFLFCHLPIFPHITVLSHYFLWRIYVHSSFYTTMPVSFIPLSYSRALHVGVFLWLLFHEFCLTCHQVLCICWADCSQRTPIINPVCKISLSLILNRSQVFGMSMWYFFRIIYKSIHVRAEITLYYTIRSA